jgi:hypothetical protein
VGRARDSGRARKRSREDIGGLEGRLGRGVTKFISSSGHVVCYIFLVRCSVQVQCSVAQRVHSSLTMSTDYSVFASPDFDPNEYANASLAGEPYPPQTLSHTQPPTGVKLPPLKTTGLEPAKEDISVAISKLDFGIEDVSKQIKNVVRPRSTTLSVFLCFDGNVFICR